MKTKLEIIMIATVLTISTTGCTDQTSSSTTDSDAPFANITPIDSSQWVVDPAKFGMTAEEFIRAESLQFMTSMEKREGINNFFHFTSLAKAEDRWVVSPNNDVIYSMAIVDASKGFTLTLPDTGDRFITAQIVSEEHMSHQLVGGGVYKFTGKEFNGSHVAIGIRVGTDASVEDVKYIVEKLQPQMQVVANSKQPISGYDSKTLLKVRAALMTEYNKLDDTFGQMQNDVKKVTNWEKFTYATAGAWGLAEDKYAMYLPYNLKGAKKDTCYRATYMQPKVDQFWSITAYNREKYLMSNENNIVNTGNAKLNEDGTFTVHFGSKAACNGASNIKNFILTTEDDWGFLIRAYEPDIAALERYKIPELTIVKNNQASTGEADITAIGKVNWDNYVVAETDLYFRGVQQKVGVNTWMHDDPVSIDNQQVIRSNRDVVYSIAVVDVSAGATFSVSAPGPDNDAFQIIHIMDENHLFHKVVRRGESITINASDLTTGTHVYLLARTKDNGNYKDTKRRQALLKFIAKSNKPYQVKNFAEKDVIAYRDKLVGNVMTGKATVTGLYGFGATLNDIRDNDYKYAAAVGWGGLPASTAQYLPAIMGQGSKACQTWTVPNPNLDYKNRGGYWSITAYSAKGWIETDKFYLSGEKMQDNGDDTSTAYFNCPDIASSLKVTEGWTAIVRFYEPVDVQEGLKYLEKIASIPLKIK